MSLEAHTIDWGTYKGLRFIDIDKHWLNRVKDYMMAYFREYRIFNLLNMFDDPLFEEDVKLLLKHILNSNCSLVIVENDEIKGVVLMKYMTKAWYCWGALRLLVRSKSMSDLLEMIYMALMRHISRNPNDEVTASLHIFFYQLDQQLIEDRCFMRRFFQVIYNVGRLMKMSHLTYMALMNNERQMWTESGFAESVRTIYSMYITNGYRPFDKLRDMDEMFGSLYIRSVERLIPYEEYIIRHPHLTTKETPKKKPAKLPSIKPVAAEIVADD